MKPKFLFIYFFVFTLSNGLYGQNSYKIIRIIKELSSDFQTIQKQVNEREDLEIFSNSVKQTIKALKMHRDSYHNWGLEIPLENLIASEIDMDVYNVDLFNNEPYWEELKSGLINYGAIESRKIENHRLNLLCKQQYINSVPTNLLLINQGEFAGFFVDSKGDLFIPGLALYNKLLENIIHPANYRTTPFYFKGHFADALTEIDNEAYESAIVKLNEIIDLGLFNELIHDDLYKQRGYAHSQTGNYQQAHKDFNKSIEICINTNQDLGDIFAKRAHLHHKIGLYDHALRDLREAYKLEKNETRKEELRLFIESIEKDMTTKL